MTRACKVSYNPAECLSVDCTKTMGNGFFSPYGTGKKYYALCKTTAATETDPARTEISMYSCADGAQFDKTVAVSACVYKCPAESRYPYSLNEQMYYNCRKVDGKLVGFLSKCPAKTVFDPVKKKCVVPSNLN